MNHGKTVLKRVDYVCFTGIEIWPEMHVKIPLWLTIQNSHLGVFLHAFLAELQCPVAGLCLWLVLILSSVSETALLESAEGGN